jgi:hypothetical protein
MGLLGRFFGKKEEPAEFDIGKFPGLEAPASQALPGLGSAPGGPGLTEMPGEMPGRMDGRPDAMPGFDDIGNAPPAPFPGMGTEGRMPAGRGQLAPSAFAPAPVMQSPGAAQGYDSSRDMQVVNAKLDTLKALLDSVNAKLDRMERSQAPKEEEAIPLSVRRWR